MGHHGVRPGAAAVFCCVRSAERTPRFHLGAPHLQKIGVRQPRRIPVLVVPVAIGTGVSGQAAAARSSARAAYGENFEYGPIGCRPPERHPRFCARNAAAAAHAFRQSLRPPPISRRRSAAAAARASSPSFGHAHGTASLSRRLPSHCTNEKASLASRRPKVHGDCGRGEEERGDEVRRRIGVAPLSEELLRRSNLRLPAAARRASG